MAMGAWLWGHGYGGYGYGGYGYGGCAHRAIHRWGIETPSGALRRLPLPPCRRASCIAATTASTAAASTGRRRVSHAAKRATTSIAATCTAATSTMADRLSRLCVPAKPVGAGNS